VRRLPQVLLNVHVDDRDAVAASEDVQIAVAVAQVELGDQGRVLLRPSGTEQLVRVMVEAATEDEAGRVAEQVAHVVAAAR
jgi:phosphoglucosamine mutase